MTERRSIPDPPHYHTSGVLIERVTPRAGRAGEVIEIHGRRFGTIQGSKVVAINRGRVNRANVQYWSENLIRVRIPDYLDAGSYRVLVYYDDSFRTSSNSVELNIAP